MKKFLITKDLYRVKHIVVSLLIFIIALCGAVVYKHLFPTSQLVAALVGSEIGVSRAKFDQQNPYLIHLPDKELYFAVWEDWRNQNTSGSDIWGKFMTADGTPCGSGTGEFQITNSTGNETLPRAAYRPADNKIVIVWQDTRLNYVYYTTITSLPDKETPSAYVFPVASSGIQISFNQFETFTYGTRVKMSASVNIGTGDGTKTDFVGSLTRYVVPGSVYNAPTTPAFNDDGTGKIRQGGTEIGSIDYNGGTIAIKFSSAPAAGVNVIVNYEYITEASFKPGKVSLGDTLVNRIKPKITYDAVNDRFIVVWIEARNVRRYVSRVAFETTNPSIAAYEFDKQSFIGYVLLAGNNLLEQTNYIGKAGADLLRNEDTTSVRLISKSESTLKETYIYESFIDMENPDVACDTTSNSCLIVFEGKRTRQTLTSTCEDRNNNKSCDLADAVTHVLTSEDDFSGGSKHIYSMVNNSINLSLPTVVLDTNTTAGADAINPAIAFDHINKKFLVAWEDLRNGQNTKIYGRLLNSGGDLYKQDFIITDGTRDPAVANSKQTAPFISYDAVNQRYFVIWQDARNGTVSLENLDIYGQYVDGEGTIRGANYAISTAQANQWAPVISYNPTKSQFLAVWKDARNFSKNDCGGDVCGSDIYGQIFTLGQPQLTLLNIDNTPLSPPFLNFEQVVIGFSSTKSFKIKNTGDVALKIDCVSPLTAPFSYQNLPAQLSVCGDNNTIDLIPAADITLTVMFDPTASGTFTPNFTIKSDAEIKTVNLQGTAVSPSIKTGDYNATTNPMNFGSVGVGQIKDLTLTITNNGPVPYNITSISGINAPFSIVESVKFPLALASGAATTFTIRYNPTQGGSASAVMTINTDVGLAPSVALQGQAPLLRVSTTSLNFGVVKVGTSPTKIITVYNDGGGSLNVSCGSLPAGFTVAGCGVSVLEKQSADLTVTFTPVGVSSYAGSVAIISNSGTEAVSLSGQGTTGRIINISSSQIDFGQVIKGSTGNRSVTVTNTGSETVRISAITMPSAPFVRSYSGTLPIDLPAGQSLAIALSFSPPSPVSYSSSFTVTSNADNATQTISMQGEGIETNILYNGSQTPNPVSFSNVTTGMDKTMNLIIKNEGTLPVTIGSVNAPQSPFSITVSVPKTIRPGESLIITVKFSPASAGDFSSLIGILYDHATEPVTINVTGTGVATGGGAVGNIRFRQNNVDVTSISVGNVLKGSVYTVSPKASLKNNSASDITITEVYTSDNVFTTDLVSGNLPFTVAGSGEKTFDIKFMPSAIKEYNATLTFKDSTGTLYQLSLFGKGVSATAATQDVGVNIQSNVISVSDLPAETKPSTFTPSGAVAVMMTNVKAATANVTVTFDKVPTNPVFYKIGKANTWKQLYPKNEFTGVSNVVFNLADASLKFTIEDNGDGDKDPATGSIYDPVIVGSVVSGSEPSPTPGVATGGSGGCFIATVAYGSYLDPHVVVLRDFRDRVLMKTNTGRQLVKFYYQTSPPIADFIGRHEPLRAAARLVLTPIVLVVLHPFAFIIIVSMGGVFFAVRRKKRVKL